MKTKTIIAIIISVCLSQLSAYSQDTVASLHQSELTREVAALDEFHSVVFKIWHSAWPEKNVTMLAELLPEVERLSAPLLSAELPGILRDKEVLWKVNCEILENAVADYKEAAAPIDTQKLLDAAEQLHGTYEKLVRLIRPVLPEMEDFHASLYLLYHYYLPQYDLDKIRGSANEMARKIETLVNAELPEQYASKRSSFMEARSNLSESVLKLQETVKSGNKESVCSGIETLHSNYQVLEGVFE